jgi:glycosyltransferase involved in cell wall biosynthesis
MDYRPALRGRSGVGEYAHGLARALSAPPPGEPSAEPIDLTLFSSSWKDRLHPGPDLAGVHAIDLRIPVRGLNLAWHRLGWPSVERLTAQRFDVTHSLHPLLMPSRASARVVTIHDLHFMRHPERTRGEVRRDYPRLARAHAHEADHVIVVSRFTADEVVRQLGLPAERMSVCPPGAPDWHPRGTAPGDGYILFLGTLEPRKNVGALLDAYELLLASGAPVPDLVLAGQATREAAGWIERAGRAPLAGRVRLVGYVEPSARQTLYEGARVLVQPSFEEGFGIPVLEAMTLGVPVVAARSGALPEVLGDAGLLVDAQRPDTIAAALTRMLHEPFLAGQCAMRGIERSRLFNWAHTARLVQDAYRQAVEYRRARTGHPACASA